MERFREGRDRSEDSGRGYSLHPGNIHESAPDQGRVRTNVGLVGFQPEAHEAHESRRGRRSEEQQADLGILAKVVGQQERGVRGIEQDVHPARASGEIVESKLRVGGSPMPDHEEAPHGKSNAPESLRIQRKLGYLFISMHNSSAGEGFKTRERLERFAVEWNQRQTEGFRDWNPVNLLAVPKTSDRSSPIDNSRPPPMGERPIHYGPGIPDPNRTICLLPNEGEKGLALGVLRGNLPSWKGPKTSEQRARFAPDEQHAAVRLNKGERYRDDGDRFPVSGLRNLPLLSRGPSETLGFQRTPIARRRGGRADRRAEFHERLIELARRLRGHEADREFADAPSGGALRDVLSNAEQSRNHAGDVSVDGRDRDAERDARDRAGRVRPHAGEGGEPLERRGHLSSVLLDDRTGRGVQIPRPPVEAQAFPYREHVVDGSGRKIVDSWESLEETLIVGEAARNP